MRTSPFTEEHEQLRAAVRGWVDDELTPNVPTWEQAGGFPEDVVRRAGELGFLGLSVPVEDGGQGGDHWATVVVLEELARACASLALTLAVQTDVIALRTVGTEDQRHRWLHPVLAGTAVLAIASTEPGGGSDPGAVTMTARPDGDGWVLDGTKAWVTNGGRADVVLVVARCHAGRTLFAVDAGTSGVQVTERIDSLGMRAADVAVLRFDGVHVAGDALIGLEGDADRVLAADLQRERLAAAVVAVASAGVELERAMAYARERQAFGRPIARFQAVAHRLVEMATAVEASRRQVYEAVARWSEDGQAAGDDRVALEVAAANLAAAGTAWQVVDDALQVHGGYGYSEEFPVERAWRDARAGRLTLGPDEVQRERIGELLAEDPGTVVAAPRRLFDDRHERVRAEARAFVDRDIVPNVDAWEADRDFPKELFRTVGAAGWFGAKFDPRWGGSGPDLLAEVCWLEELARAGSGGLAADLGATSQLAAVYLDRQGTDEQKQRWLVPSITGEAVGALAVTEPGAGSDVNGIRTRARRDGADWVLDGAKVFITNGAWCDHVVLAARTDPDAGHRGLTLFVVERGMPGFSSRRMGMLGWQTSHTGELALDGVHVPDGHRLGEVGGGFLAIMDNFAWERLTLALGAIVAAEESLRLAVAHAAERSVGGRRLLDHQVWRHRLADLATDILGARALTDHAVDLHVRDQSGEEVERPTVLRATAMAKLVTQRLAVEVADACLQVHGAAGYRRDRAPQRFLRDARLGPIGGGTDDIMRQIIAGTYGL